MSFIDELEIFDIEVTAAAEILSYNKEIQEQIYEDCQRYASLEDGHPHHSKIF